MCDHEIDGKRDGMIICVVSNVIYILHVPYYHNRRLQLRLWADERIINREALENKVSDVC